MMKKAENKIVTRTKTQSLLVPRLVIETLSNTFGTCIIEKIFAIPKIFFLHQIIQRTVLSSLVNYSGIGFAVFCAKELRPLLVYQLNKWNEN